MHPSRLRLILQQPLFLFAVATSLLVVFVWHRHAPVFDMEGDAPTYYEAMEVMNGSIEASPTFTPNRILTTFFSTGTVSLLGLVTDNYLWSWRLVNTFYLFGLAFVSFFLFRRVTGSAIGSVIGALFVVGNYDVVTFGLNYLMDSTGWFWFMVSALFLFMHMDRAYEERVRGNQRYLWLAVVAAGVGGLFKEYAYIAVLPIGVYLLWEYGRKPLALVKRSVPLAVLFLVPTIAINIAIYLIYGYSYLDWYGMNAETFAYDGWLWNFSRSVVVLLSVMLPLVVIGVMAFVREMRESFDMRRLVFVSSLLLPALSALLWPIITERLVFLVVPLAALFTAYAVKRYEREWPYFIVLWLVYVAIAIRTDGLILNYLYAL